MKFISFTFIFFLSCSLTRISGDKQRVIGGSACEQDYMYFISIRQVSTNNRVCGGSLLSAFWVLTAAHCPSRNVYASTGMRDDPKSLKFLWAKVTKSHRHPGFDLVTLRNDIALMKLGSPLFESDVIAYVSLPTEVFHGDVSKRCPKALVIGFGRTDFSSESMSEVLNCVMIKTITYESCLIYYRLWSITDDVICTLAEGKDACQGDSGGPLLCDDVQYGIVSWGILCDSGFPGVYTRVDKYLEFIERTMNRSWSKKYTKKLLLLVTVGWLSDILR